MAVGAKAQPAVEARARAARSLPLLQAGFRPFFLLSGLWAAVAVGLWIPAYLGHMTLPTAFDPMTWHLHEAIYGFGAAAVAGFLLTAVPNWTGRLPIAGARLAGLVGLWVAGRVFCLLSGWSGWLLAMAVDLAFLSVLFVMILREVMAGKNWRNLPPAVAVLVLALGNAAVHLQDHVAWLPYGFGGRLGLAVLLMLIALIGGRIVPSFTRNWLAKRKADALPTPFGRLDRVALIAALIALLGWVLFPHATAVGALLALAGALHFLRLARWRGLATLAEPLLTILHVGYFWFALGLLLLGVEILTGIAALRGGMHALAAGAAGTMILAVMTRASLGHSGRDLTADAGTSLCYLLVTVAAAMRVIAPALPGIEITLLAASALAWIGGFGLFVALYAPLLLRRV
ncbi:NnrS family protein [Aquibaculum arenosum]|uniref:NnrS family protein n=1 Tax=Aquibaculum arenosum TaxID=3032591 RepID=A0ABT5YJF0_9PROT|nr:NnrS family protein [Fodinicurvata sp. CAU 1616]MDF2095071.1 NnrS family protein [Fodinicurvata sp. CAU 1616]